MPGFFRKIAALLAVGAVLAALAACAGLDADGKAAAPLPGDLISKLKDIGSSAGAPMMMRIFKEDSVLEVWKQASGGQYALLKTYNICAWSGGLGPKVTEGDRQAPEGFYDITPGLMNPKSNYYLAFNTGFPNKFDRAYGRTGANLMVHGDCSSSGCYAMSDKEIAELFSLVRDALAGGSRAVQLEIFPFRMTPANLVRVAGNTNMAFWKNIKSGYDAFELTKKPPTWDVCNKHYVFDATGPDGKPLDATAPCPALKTDPTLTAELSAKIAADNAAFATVAPTDGVASALQTALDKKAAAMGGDAAGPTAADDKAGATGVTVATPKAVAPLPAPQRT